MQGWEWCENRGLKNELDAYLEKMYQQYKNYNVDRIVPIK